jgi:hypothetical protein
MRAALAVAVVLLFACGGAQSPDARYPARKAGCPVKKLPAEPSFPVDDLGVVTVDCTSLGDRCERALLDAVCDRGGDVAWGLGDNALTTMHPTAHAAHTQRARENARGRDCEVRVFDRAPPMATENIGEVSAYCAADDPAEACMRELEDQVCKMGGDVLWQVEGPRLDGDKQRIHGRAAHSR